MLKFNELTLRDEILQAVDDMGFEVATPIQELAIPVALSGKDVIGQAQTGTGKTAAFAIPFLQLLNSDPLVQVLVLTPTRELCIQVEKEIHKLSRYLPVRSLAVYGGQEITRQIRGLKDKPQIIVATPGRLMDHMDRHTIKLQNLKFVVLDEADEMLNMGFLEDIETILAACPEDRQTMMFSATMRSEIKSIAERFMKEPELVKVKASQLTVPSIEQDYYEVAEDRKSSLLCRLLDIYTPELAMVFGRTKRRVDEVTEGLQKLGYQAEGLHGDLTQRHRDMVMNKFRNGQINILVATDVAARGLDITGVSHVFNFDLPQDIDSYVHRIGRTGRAGKDGLALTFVEPREMAHLQTIEATIKCKLTRKKVPTLKDAQAKKQEKMYNELAQAMDEGKYNDYQNIALHLLEEYEASDILAAALEMLGGESNREHEVQKIKLTAERPIIVKRLPKKGRDGRYHGGKGGKNYYHHDKKNGKKDYKDQPKDGKNNSKKNYSKKDNYKDYDKKNHKKSSKKGYFLGE
mgnify:FL=1